jgi:hypothetical protein
MPLMVATTLDTQSAPAFAFEREPDLTIRAITRTVPLDVRFMDEWKTPFCVGDENELEVVLDVEAILLDDFEQTGAVECYREQALTT